MKSYPLVAKVAWRLLAIPVTLVASKRLFSKAGDVITKKRNRQSACANDGGSGCLFDGEFVGLVCVDEH